eukprot:TRINITY_DN11714_c0_g1_i1.p1 TRINITY_DN11714_c0_g1~~TRINITY_DN11714_c0_g1_i1.p1  ORF type:complete len:188 (-),score=13.47 TRINITY_DN11714_c0_g1_i1:64-627(-)
MLFRLASRSKRMQRAKHQHTYSIKYETKSSIFSQLKTKMFPHSNIQPKVPEALLVLEKEGVKIEPGNEVIFKNDLIYFNGERMYLSYEEDKVVIVCRSVMTSFEFTYSATQFAEIWKESTNRTDLQVSQLVSQVEKNEEIIKGYVVDDMYRIWLNNAREYLLQKSTYTNNDKLLAFLVVMSISVNEQ